MAKSPQQIDHAAEFWDRHLAQPYINDDKSLSLLGAAIASLKAKSTFSLEHIQALVLSVSLSEGQMRDCIRLAIDSSFMEIDPENPLIKDVKFDFRLLNSVRDRRLTVGGFFALNTSISTVSRFWHGAELAFSRYDFFASYANWDDVRKGDPAEWAQKNPTVDFANEPEEETPSIVVTSYEGSKGRSAQYVFLVGVHSGEMPNNAADIKDIEICRFLVGLTRTKKRCSVMVTRNAMGQYKNKSEFLGWISAKRYIHKKIDAAYWKQS
jgi:hypothetical protein